MKLEPVFVVAPQPHLGGMPTRRAFLIAGSTFTLGTVVGGACGYSIAVATQGAGAPAEEVIPPSGDVELEELRRLAVKAPIDELYAKRIVFTMAVANDYRNDKVLWRGIARLGQAVLDDAELPDRRIGSKLVAQVIELADSPHREQHASLAKELRKIR